MLLVPPGRHFCFQRLLAVVSPHLPVSLAVGPAEAQLQLLHRHVAWLAWVSQYHLSVLKIALSTSAGTSKEWHSVEPKL